MAIAGPGVARRLGNIGRHDVSLSGAWSALRDARATLLIIGGLIALRLLAAAITPLAYDEAYYWLWSKALAGGYYDHPPMVAYVIKLGTILAGDTQLGIRLASILLAIPATWAVWRAAAILFRRADVARDAALLFNLTLMVAAGTAIVTPDAPLMVASAFVLWAVAKVIETGRGEWWLAVGLTAGLALLSKYTAFFLGAGIVAWMLIVSRQRRWLLTPWPYLGGAVALAVFSPVIVWNIAHDGVSFAKQFGRAVVETFSLRYIGEIVPTQLGLATPPVFVLGIAGMWALARGRNGSRDARVLVGALIWPALIYFVWHSLHARVQANWLSLLYPPFAIAAAVAAHDAAWTGRARRLVAHARKRAVPVAAGLFVLVAAQATLGVVPLGSRDPTTKKLAAGFDVAAHHIDAIRNEVGAAGVLTTSYSLTGWLAFYLPSRPPVVQVNQRIRWINAPPPDARLRDGVLLYVCEDTRDFAPLIRQKFAKVRRIGTATRARHGEVIERYNIYAVEGARGDPFADDTPR
jgi:4-amino-4-deoxy-L-arabinose transferase-like glycosyltransferase